MTVTKIQMREWGLKKFIILKIDNRSKRMGVIHDDGVTKVNRKNHQGFYERPLRTTLLDQGVPIVSGTRFKPGFGDQFLDLLPSDLK